ncbi:histone deacetylase, partial [Synechococcus sp. CCY9201]|nr:histone deacetylase [Synechococcus sp. CCY9201]
ASVHEWGNYPGSGAATERGEGPGLGFTLNCPLPGGSDGPAVLTALTAVLRPAAERFRPQLVLVSAGFDSHRDDPLGSFRLEDSDYGALTQLCLDIASEHADGRLVSVLEGGYALQGLAGGAAAHVETLLASGSAPTGSGPA